jgi:hypothetical protein
VNARCLTPPQVARRWAVSPEKVIALIGRGELRAFNVGLGHRPRWRIPEDAVAAFEQRRGAQPALSVSRSRKRAEPAVIEFF